MMRFRVASNFSRIKGNMITQAYLLKSRNIFSAITDVFKKEDLSKYDKDIFNFEQEKYEPDTFDYIIVGGGTSGAALAWRLLDEGSNHVAIFEAGSLRPCTYSMIPGAMKQALNSSKCTKTYYTVPQKGLNNREMPICKGRGFGGSSNINNMIFLRGDPEDYNNWVKQGVEGWAYNDCLPYFKKIETCDHGSAIDRGKHGPINLVRQMDGYCSSLSDAFLKAGKEAGYKLCDDFNTTNREGFGFFDLTVEDGRRHSVSQAYIPFDYLLDYWGSQLFMKTGHKVDRLTMDGDKVIGVESKGKCFLAKKEVILCAGAIETPVLLMRSGIGGQNQLKKNGIAVNVDLRGVGNNLQDHTEISFRARTNHQTFYNIERSMFTSLMSLYYWYCYGEGPWKTNHMNVGALLKSDPNITSPDICLLFTPHIFPNDIAEGYKFNAFQISAIAMKPESRGDIILTNNGQNVVINPKYMDAKKDMDDMMKCVEIVENLMKQPSLESLITHPLTKSTPSVTNFIKNNIMSSYDLCGTCKMGAIENDVDAVVDHNLRVKGVRNLRVADSSVIPDIISGNLTATAVMIAEKASRAILSEYPTLRPERYKKRVDGVIENYTSF